MRKKGTELILMFYRVLTSKNAGNCGKSAAGG